MTKEHWNEIVEGGALGIQGDDPLPHTVCNWTVCIKPSGHDGPCDIVALETPGKACGEIAFRMGFGPCWQCPPIYDQ